MSKVFKQSDSFTPEKILPGSGHEVKEPIWDDLAKRIDSQPRPTIEDPNSQHVSSTEDLAETQVPEDEESPPTVGAQDVFDDDFSAPSPTAAETARETPPEPAPIDLEAITQEAYNSGYEECLKNVEADYLSSTKALMTACTEINSVRETILNNSMSEMQNLVFKIAEKILRISVTEQNDTIRNTVEEAIRRAVKSDEFVIHVNPDDYENIEEKSADFINSFSGLESIVVKPDKTIDRGGCIIESSNCTVDATIDVQLEMIKNSILEHS